MAWTVMGLPLRAANWTKQQEDNSQGNGLLLLWENCGFSDSPTQIREYYQQILERVLGIIIESLWSRNVRRNYLK